jgi:hypothetical protein
MHRVTILDAHINLFWKVYERFEKKFVSELSDFLSINVRSRNSLSCKNIGTLIILYLR